MRVQRVVDVIWNGELLVQTALKDPVLLELADGAPHDVSHGGRYQAEMKFQFKSRERNIRKFRSKGVYILFAHAKLYKKCYFHVIMILSNV